VLLRRWRWRCIHVGRILVVVGYATGAVYHIYICVAAVNGWGGLVVSRYRPRIVVLPVKALVGEDRRNGFHGRYSLMPTLRKAKSDEVGCEDARIPDQLNLHERPICGGRRSPTALGRNTEYTVSVQPTDTLALFVSDFRYDCARVGGSTSSRHVVYKVQGAYGSHGNVTVHEQLVEARGKEVLKLSYYSLMVEG